MGTALSVADKLYVQTVKFLEVDEQRVKLVDAQARSNQELGTANEQLAAANERLAAVARIDELTGIPNRRAFDEGSSTIAAASRRDGFFVSLLMFDINWFKKVVPSTAAGRAVRRLSCPLALIVDRPAMTLNSGLEVRSRLPAASKPPRRQSDQLGLQGVR